MSASASTREHANSVCDELCIWSTSSSYIAYLYGVGCLHEYQLILLPLHHMQLCMTIADKQEGMSVAALYTHAFAEVHKVEPLLICAHQTQRGGQASLCAGLAVPLDPAA